MSDLRYAIRLLRKSPLFTITVVLTIALGIGASTVIFSVVNAILLRPLPYGQPQRLIQVAEKNDALRLPQFGVSALNYLSWKERTRTIAEMGAVGFGTYTLSGRGDPETYAGNTISPSLIPLLKIQPVAGRTFTEDDARPGSAPVAMIGDALWQRRFGADRGIVGRPAIVNGTAYTVIGIAPASLTTLTTGEIFVPLVIDPPKEMRLNHVLFVSGRLKDGVTIEAAQAEMNAVAHDMSQQYPEMKEWGVTLITFTDAFVSSQLRTALLVLLGAAVFLLLIVSANIANLLLSRAIERRREMAIRAALGAGRSRLWRQVLIESLVLSAAGGAAGFALAVWGVALLESSLPPNTLPIQDIGIDPTVTLFVVGVTMMTGIVFGLAPAWQSSTVDVNTTLKTGGRSASGARPLLRKSLAGVELALATVLLVGAVLLGRSLMALQRVPLGFEPEGVLSLQVTLPPTKYPMVKRVQFYHDLMAALRTIPGVRHAGLSSGIPFGSGNYTQSPMGAPGSAVLAADASVPIDWRVASPGYFDTVKIPLLRGRDFNDSDTATAPAVMIVSRAAARSLWGDGVDPIGRTIRRVADKRDFTVVGLVGDVRSRTLNNESPSLYYSSNTSTWPLMDIVLRSDLDRAALLAGVRREVRKLDPEIPLSNVRPMTEWISTSAAQPRLNASLLAVFAGVALLVAAIGTYGVLAYSVSQRTKELGLRMALGASRGDVLSLIVREGMTIGAAGIAVGVIAAIGMSRLLSALIFGVSVWDPMTYGGVLLALVAIALVACLVPALRASRVDPMQALRLD